MLRYTQLFKQLSLRKTAFGAALAAYILGAAYILSTAGLGFAAGYGAGKLTEPGLHDTSNLLKQYKLQRMKKDNEVQKVQEQREASLRDMRNNIPKAMRFG